ncbi:MAG: asparagine synthase (glutamine-hydrolyzing) [Bacteroidia bacterium]|nr:asparagine synthase (glutamine-hydrolyzing) [Bacteroidia bacterium]
MCGIAGFIDASLKHAERGELLEKMLQAIAHRGPDARGKHVDGPVALGHNRLSIIDLSADGNQPMQRGRNYIVYNGEVYNYRELRKSLETEGYAFSTQSDTEVILAAYERYGTDCVQHFVGMWAFALWDGEQQHLFCSRDRFGIKPFYYLLQGGRFYFGSEYKALFPSPLFRPAINEAMVAMGLQLGWNTWNDASYYSGLHALPAAHNLVFKDGAEPEITRYWDIDSEKQIQLNWQEACEHFRSMFLESISLHMRSDVEVGGCLSGGLDSSAIAGVIGRDYSHSRFKTFTVYYEGEGEVDERPWVSKVLGSYPSLEPYYYTPTDADIQNSFERALWHADVPLAGSSPVSQYFVMQLAASQGIKVLLDGQGSDEFLGGYMHSFYRLIGGAFRNLKAGQALSEISAHAARQDFGMKKQADILLKSLLAGVKSEQDLYELEYRKYLPFLPKSDLIPFHLREKQGSRLNQFLYQLSFASSLPTLLQFEDRNSMAFSIESRVPFLDHRLVEFAFSLPDEAKIHQGATKRILRESLRGILPEAIAGRKDKKGFVTPGEVKWLRGPLAHLLEQDFSQIDFLRPDTMKSVVEDFKKGDNRHANLVWRLAVLRKWMG